jgi:hypothetical protein
MTRQSAYVYRVVVGEEVTIAVTPVGVAPLVVASVDGRTLDNVGSTNQPAFGFTVLAGPEHAVVLRFDFPPDASDDSHYITEVHGSKGGGWYMIPPFYKGDGDGFGLGFRVTG